MANTITRKLYEKGQGFFTNQNYTGALDLSLGGQSGYAPVLAEWVNNQAYVRHQLIPILLQYPKFFDKFNNKDVWIKTLKSLVELHVRTIDGFNAELRVETDTHPVGGGGELQDEVTNVVRERSVPRFSFVEKYGMPIATFLYYWITYGIQDPDTKYALINTITGDEPAEMTAEQYSMTMLFIEPDPTHRKVLKSWITTNMYPKGTGQIIGKRDLSSDSEINTIDVEFTGISQFSLGTNAFAQTILDKIRTNLVDANPYFRKHMIDRDENIRSDYNGYETNIENLKKDKVS